MSVKTLLKLNRLFKLPEHPFNTQAAGGTTYAEWEYERAEGGLSLFAPWYAPGDIVFRKDVLDLGCGAGGKGVWYAEKYGAKVIGIDREERYAEEAGAFARRRGVDQGDIFSRSPGAGSFRFLLADAADTGLPAESFDTIILSDALEHLSDPEAVLSECVRLLKPGGRIFISFPPYGHPCGEHLTDLIGIPYVQLFFSETEMTAAYAQLAEDLPEDKHPNGAERIAFRFTRDADGTLRNTYINKMTLKRFEGIRRRLSAPRKDGSASLKTVLYREKPLRGWLLPLARLPGVKEHFVRMAVCVLEKPQAPRNP